MSKEKHKDKIEVIDGGSQHTPESQMISTTTEIHAGPLPSARELSKYEQVLPGLADRIVTMAESQSVHRQEIENRVITSDSYRATFGLVFAFIIVIGGIIASVYLILNDKQVSGLLLGGTPLAVVVGAFIYQKRNTTEE